MRIVLITAALAAFGLAQPFDWDVVRMTPSVAGSDLCFLADGQHGWMVGSGGAGTEVLSAVFATTDAGAHWLQLPFPDSAFAAVNGVFFVSESTGWVVGNAGYIRKTTDAGMTWQTQSSPLGRKLNRVHFVNANLGWITGGWQDGAAFPLLKTTNGGSAWQDLSFGSNCYSCEDIWFADSLDGWIVGQDASINPFIEHTTDGGASWTSQVTNLPTGNGPVSSVCFPTAKVGWATSSSIYQVPSGSILHTTNGGDTWTVQSNTGQHYNYAIDAPDTLHVAILSTQVLSPAAGKIVVSTNGGQSWSSYSLPTYSYGSGCQYRGSTVWVAQDNSQVLSSSANGADPDWQLYAPYWTSIAWSSEETGWLVAGSSTGGGYCFKTTDGGATWQRDAAAPGGAQAQFLDANHGWMLQEGNSAKVNRTTDGGANWSQFGVGTSNWVGRMRFATNDSGWACGASGTMRFSSNGGASWTAQSLGTSNYCEDVFMLNSREGWAAGGYGGSSGFVRHTTDGGASWFTQNPATTDHVNRVFFLNDRLGWLGAYGGLVQGTTDGGATWGILGSVPHFYFEDLLFTDSLTGWAAAGNASGGGDDGRGFIYKTTNGGISWTQEYGAPWPKGWVKALGMQPGGTLWACGNHNTLLASAGAQWVEEKPATDARGLSLNVLPNPFSGRCEIRLTASAPGRGRLAISDVSGRLVKTLDVGGQSAVWDGTDRNGRSLPGGVYFCRLTTAGSRVQVKLCLNRD